MFGGHGISTGGLTLALLADLGQGETLWLKAGPDTCAVFEAAGCQRFTYQAKGKARRLGFYSAPVEAIKLPARWRPGLISRCRRHWQPGNPNKPGQGRKSNQQGGMTPGVTPRNTVLSHWRSSRPYDYAERFD